jgi:chemotaxis signal transduction protein
MADDRNTHDSVWERIARAMERIDAYRNAGADPAVAARKLAERGKALRQTVRSTAPTGELLPYLAFHKGKERFGIPMKNVVEVVTLEHCSPVPLAPPFSPGVLLWRGTILALLDLAVLCEIPQAGIADVHVCIVAEAADRRVGIVANDVDDLVNAPAAAVIPAPELGDGIPQEWLLGVHDGSRMIFRLESVLSSPRMTQWKHSRRWAPTESSDA